VKPLKPALHLAGSGVELLLELTSRPGQSPIPTAFQRPEPGVDALRQRYILPGLAPPVQEAVTTFL
jgi:hypothetical protein